MTTDVLRYASIPVIAALIGYATNWLAVRMTFRPLEFVGPRRPWLGWQGIIPRKAKRMAAIAVDASLAKLASLSEIFEEIDPDRLAEQLLAELRPRAGAITDEIMEAGDPELWRSLPEPVREAVRERVRRQLPRAVDGLVHDIGENVEHLLDLRLMVVERLAEDRSLLNRIFQEVGEEEFAFIIRSGAYFGLPLGLLQMGLWIAVPAWWVLPAAGFVVGYATNWLALNLIFRPVEPARIGPFVLHGLFLRRQDEVAGEYAHIVTEEILTVSNLVDELMNGPRGDRTRALVRRHVEPIVDEAAGIARPAVRLSVGDQGYADIKEQLSSRAFELSEEALDDPAFDRERARAVRAEMRDRMRDLSAAEFQQLLRPAFQEDEMKLILVGAGLGTVAGALQLILVFGGAA